MHPTTLMSQMVHRFPDCCIGVMWSCHHASHYPNGIELPWIFILLSWISISEQYVWQDSGTILTLISEWFIYFWIVVVFVKCFFSQTKRMATNAPNVTTSPALLALIWIVSPDPFTNIRGDSTYINWPCRTMGKWQWAPPSQHFLQQHSNICYFVSVNLFARVPTKLKTKHAH